MRSDYKSARAGVEIIGNRILFNSGRYDKEKEQYMYFIQQ